MGVIFLKNIYLNIWKVTATLVYLINKTQRYMIRKTSWVLPLIESKVYPVLQNYYERPLDETVSINRKLLHSIIKSRGFGFWYWAPDEMQQLVGNSRHWNKYTWKKWYSQVRYLRKYCNTSPEEEVINNVFPKSKIKNNA